MYIVLYSIPDYVFNSHCRLLFFFVIFILFISRVTFYRIGFGMIYCTNFEVKEKDKRI